jgi:hypothetical protein
MVFHFRRSLTYSHPSREMVSHETPVHTVYTYFYYLQIFLYILLLYPQICIYSTHTYLHVAGTHTYIADTVYRVVLCGMYSLYVL